MSSEAPVFVLLNPAAGRGRGGKRIEGYLSLLRRHLPAFRHAFTERAGHEVELVDRALAEGQTSIVAVGGDGTWSIVADRIVRSGHRDVTLGLLPSGTGNDFGKSVGIRFERSEEVVRGIAAGRRRTVDVGRVGDRYFLNVIGFGFDIAVIDDAEGFPILKGDMLYRFCALRQLFRFPGIPIELSNGIAPPERKHHLMLTISNANYFGGSFHIAPRASLNDGKLDAVSIYDAGPFARARLFSLVGKGGHEGDRRVHVQQSERFRVGFDRPVRFEIDGEVHDSGPEPLDVVAVPDALTLFVPDD